MAKFEMTKPQMSGIALGGIGTGSVELWPDGEFHYWQIANESRWGNQCEQDKMEDGEQHAGALSFWVRAEREDGKPVLRKLGMKTDPSVFTYRMFAWNKPVGRIVYDGRFPVCELSYEDRGLPCGVKMTATAPFAPGHTELSALPGFQMEFELTNPTNKPLRVSLIGSVEPSFISGGDCENRLVREDGVTAIRITSRVRSEDANCGNICLSVSGDGKETYLTADYFRYLREYVAYSDFGVSQECFLFPFRETGRLPDTEAGARPPEIPENLNELTDEEINTLTSSLMAYPFARSLPERVKRVNRDFPVSRADREAFLKFCAAQMKRIGEHFGSAALGREILLPPCGKAKINYVFSWYFPNHFARGGERLGHYYENLCADAFEANRLLLKSGVFEKAKAFSELLYHTDAPACYSDAWSVHLSTIVKSSWLIKDGRFGLWEGLGSCGFHTTDITYHASFGLTSLFPELQKRQMRMGAAFQREDGRVHHCFNPDLSHVDNGFERVDMNPQFVMMVCRDWLYTGDRAYLTDLWPNVIKAMNAMEQLDTDGDGLPDTDTRRNTYDAWNMSGTPAYISVLWLGALRAAEKIALEMGDGEQAAKWSKLRKKGLAALEEKLWNGAYYDLWRDGDKRDSCLMTAQLDGEWFLHMAGIGGNLPEERVKNVLTAIFNGNFDPEDGLVNATCPGETTLHTWKNCQAEALWSGVGYAVAALGLSAGMEDTARTIVEKIHENQMDLGAFWCHWECGAYYTRPLSSWTTLIALTGMKLNAAEKELSFDPKINGCLPLCFPGVVAEMTVTDESCLIKCLEGSLAGWRVTAENRAVTIA